MMREGDASITRVIDPNNPSDPRRFYTFEDCSSYAKIMRFHGVYGTDNELRVAALLYNVAIVVQIGTGVEEEFHYFFPLQFQDPRRIIYIFMAQKDGHYDSMVGTGMMDGFDIYGLPLDSYIAAAECITTPDTATSVRGSAQRRAEASLPFTSQHRSPFFSSRNDDDDAEFASL